VSQKNRVKDANMTDLTAKQAAIQTERNRVVLETLIITLEIIKIIDNPTDPKNSVATQLLRCLDGRDGLDAIDTRHMAKLNHPANED
jgi:hypothetical protein